MAGISDVIGKYTFKSPYHKNKRLPFTIISVNRFRDNTAEVQTVEYKGWKAEYIHDYWDLKSVLKMISTGFLIKTEDRFSSNPSKYVADEFSTCDNCGYTLRVGWRVADTPEGLFCARCCEEDDLGYDADMVVVSEFD